MLFGFIPLLFILLIEPFACQDTALLSSDDLINLKYTGYNVMKLGTTKGKEVRCITDYNIHMPS